MRYKKLVTALAMTAALSSMSYKSNRDTPLHSTTDFSEIPSTITILLLSVKLLSLLIIMTNCNDTQIANALCQYQQFFSLGHKKFTRQQPVGGINMIFFVTN